MVDRFPIYISFCLNVTKCNFMSYASINFKNIKSHATYFRKLFLLFSFREPL